VSSGVDADTWLSESLDKVRLDDEELIHRWSVAGRKLGARVMQGRLRLLEAALAALPPAGHVALVAELYRTGDINEKETVLRALPSLPDSARFVEIGIEAVRSNVLSIISAIACDNPFPQRHFPESAFNQMVMKCLFSGIALAHIVGLAQRRTPELRRMVDDYARERRAAGRPVPVDAALVTA